MKSKSHFDRQLGMAVTNRLASDQKATAERKWRAPLMAATDQQPCDIGIFSDDANQLDLIEMLQEPTNDY